MIAPMFLILIVGMINSQYADETLQRYFYLSKQIKHTNFLLKVELEIH